MSVVLTIMALVPSLAAGQNASASAPAFHQSLDDAWWTGPMLAPSASTLPRGHFLLEPYFYDVTVQGRFDSAGTRHGATHSNSFGSLTYFLYGLADKFTIGAIPIVGYNQVSAQQSSSHPEMGDLSIHMQYRVSQFHEGSWAPTISIGLEESFPIGRYDRLGNRPSDALGSGAYTTTLGLYSQRLFWLPNGRILRMRLNVLPAFSRHVDLTDVSVYGTEEGFRGRAYPGKSIFVDGAWEYSVTRRWVLALDATYRHDGATLVIGYNKLSGGLQNGSSIQINSGSSYAFGLAPAIEYNCTRNLGFLLGARLIPHGSNTAMTITPALAINYVH